MTPARAGGRRALAAWFLGVVALAPAAAQDFIGAWQRALTHDKVFLSAQVERDLGLQDAKRAGLVYLPGAYVEYGRAPFELGSRTSFTVVQPLVDAEKWATYREMSGREATARAGFAVGETDLARRVFAVASTLVRLRALQGLAQQEAQALDRQAQRAARRLELGTGTVMDLTMAQTQHAQALARFQSLQAEISLAQQRYLSVTGGDPAALVMQPDYVKASRFELPPALLEMDGSQSPLLRRAQAQADVARLGLTRARSAYLPQLNLVYRASQYAGNQDEYRGIQISLPMGLSAYTLSARDRAELDVLKAQAAVQEAAEQVRLASVGGVFSIQAYVREMALRNQAVQISEATVRSTEKAYEAGVVKASDVVDAILASFEVQRQRLVLHMTLTEQLLSVQLFKGVAVEPALQLLQALFDPTG